MSRATYPADMYSGWEKRPKRSVRKTQKHRMQYIIDEAENVKRTDRLTWVCIGALCIIGLILLKVFVL